MGGKGKGGGKQSVKQPMFEGKDKGKGKAKTKAKNDEGRDKDSKGEQGKGSQNDQGKGSKDKKGMDDRMTDRVAPLDDNATDVELDPELTGNLKPTEQNVDIEVEEEEEDVKEDEEEVMPPFVGAIVAVCRELGSDSEDEQAVERVNGFLSMLSR